MRMTAIWIQTERGSTGLSAVLKTRSRKARALQIRGTIRPVLVVSTTAQAARREKKLVQLKKIRPFPCRTEDRMGVCRIKRGPPSPDTRCWHKK